MHPKKAEHSHPQTRRGYTVSCSEQRSLLPFTQLTGSSVQLCCKVEMFIPTSTACISKVEARSSLSLQTGLFAPGHTVIYPQAWAPQLVVGPTAAPVPALVILGTCSWTPGLGASLRNSPVQEDHAAEGLQNPPSAGTELGRALLSMDGAHR